MMSEPSLESLNDQAESLMRDAAKSEPPAVERVLTHHPEWRRFWRSRTAFEVSDARIVIAREHGFQMWSQLTDAMRRGEQIARIEASAVNPYFEVVDKFKIKDERIRWSSIMTALPGRMGKANRGRPVSKQKLEALIWGLYHRNAAVRWGCLEHLDAHPDASAVPHIVEKLDDPVPRVRWHAVHALACDACKGGDSFLSAEVTTHLEEVSRSDESKKVRAYAAQVSAEHCRIDSL